MEKSNQNPLAIKKAALVKACYPIPDRDVIVEINEIIYNHRKSLTKNIGRSKEQISHAKYVKENELKEFAQVMGISIDVLIEKLTK